MNDEKDAKELERRMLTATKDFEKAAKAFGLSVEKFKLACANFSKGLQEAIEKSKGFKP